MPANFAGDRNFSEVGDEIAFRTRESLLIGLHRPEQLCLQSHRQLADFVRQQAAAVGAAEISAQIRSITSREKRSIDS